MNRVFLTALLTLGFAGLLEASDRWSALSMLESGDDDRAIGLAGEVSRYQIKPALWSASARGHSPSDSRSALSVAQAIMRDRTARFERRFHRHPTDFEFYVLWNAPSQLFTDPQQKISGAVAARAQRFCNLVADR